MLNFLKKETVQQHLAFSVQIPHFAAANNVVAFFPCAPMRFANHLSTFLQSAEAVCCCIAHSFLLKIALWILHFYIIP